MVGCAVARLLSHHDLDVVLARGGARHRRRHEQGQHGDPPHRLRRHARLARGPARRSRLRAAARLRADGRHLGGGSRRVAGRLGRRAGGGTAERSPRRRPPTATSSAEVVDAHDGLRAASRTSAPASPAGCSCRTSTSSTRGRRRLAFAYEAIANGAKCSSDRDVTACNVGDDTTTISRHSQGATRPHPIRGQRGRAARRRSPPRRSVSTDSPSDRAVAS